MTTSRIALVRLGAPAILFVSIVLAACTPVVTIPPELLATPTSLPPDTPIAQAALSCDQLAASFQGSTCQGAALTITLDLGQPLADLGALQVTGNGSLLTCTPAAGSPDLLECSSPTLLAGNLVVLTLCPGGCAPTAACVAGSYYDASFRACLPIPGGTGQPACPPGYSWDAPSATCLQNSGGLNFTAGKGLAALTLLSQSRIMAGCPAGQYLDNTNCVTCPAGYSCAGGTDLPAACWAGSYSGPGSANCSACPPGTFSGDGGAAACSACPAGTYNNSSGETGCLNCPPGTTSLPGQANCSAQATDTPPPTPVPACPDGYAFDNLFLTCLPLNGPTSPTCTSLVILLPACP